MRIHSSSGRSGHPGNSRYIGPQSARTRMLAGNSRRTPPSCRYPMQTRTRSRPPSTSSFVNASRVRPFTRTAIRSITRSNHPTRRGRRVVVPYSPPPRSLRCSAIGPSSSVGAGPFPTELEGPIAEHLRERGGGEYGTTTRRPRRVGWFDLVMLRMAVRVNGLTRLALTKLDVLGGLDRVRVCIGYRHNGGVLREFPASMRVLADCGPMYREFPGWRELPEDEWIRIAARGRRALPETTRRYVAFVESQLKVPVRVLSVGRSRAATMGA